MTNTLQKIKDEVSIDHDWTSWDDCYNHDGETGVMIDQIAIRYAQEVNKEVVSELEHLVKALETVSSFGATTPIIEHAKQLINKHKGGKS